MKQIIRISPVFHNLWEEYLLYMAQAVHSQFGDEFVLKGGTALKIGYDLPRISIDLDFDNLSRKDLSDFFQYYSCKFLRDRFNIPDVIIVQLTSRHFEESSHYRVGFASNDINLKILNTKLKIDISHRPIQLMFRHKNIIKNNVCLYPIDVLIKFKLNAIVGNLFEDKTNTRIKFRDFFDINYLIKTYPKLFDYNMFSKLNEAIMKNGINSYLLDFSDQANTGENVHIFKNVDVPTVIREIFHNVSLNLDQFRKAQDFSEQPKHKTIQKDQDPKGPRMS